jgi:hypothetical protein
MKFLRILKITVILLLITIQLNSQTNYQAPTLSAGLDNVTFKKGTLDVELLTKIISEKQKEIVREGIKRMIFEYIGGSKLDDYSQFYIERVTEILFQEKNHKVMTKRILEETTNYLFVLGITKVILETQNSELKEIFQLPPKSSFDDIDNIDLRNKIIQFSLSICSEVPFIKKLGLLNNFNYFEHSKIYYKGLIKEALSDLNINKINEVFNGLEKINKNDLTKINSIKQEIYELDKNEKLDSTKYVKWKNLKNSLNANIDNLLKKINLNNNEAAKTLITKLKAEQLQSINRNIYSVALKIKKHINNLLNNSNVLKDILNNSGIDFKQTKESFETILQLYEKSFNNYSYEDLIFKNVVKKTTVIDTVFMDYIDKEIVNIRGIKDQIEKEFDIEQLTETQELLEKQIDSISKYAGVIRNLDMRISSEVGTFSMSNFINQENYNSLLKGIDTTNTETVKNGLKEKLNNLNDVLQTEKNNLYIKNENLSTLLSKIDSIKKTDKFDYAKNIFSVIEVEAKNVNEFFNSGTIKELRDNYIKVRDYYKVQEILLDNWDKTTISVNPNEKQKNQFIATLNPVTKEALMNILISGVNLQKLVANSNLSLTQIQKLINHLTLLKGKIIVNGYSKTNGDGLFYMLKEYLVKNKISLNDNQNLTEDEQATLTKLMSFFLDRNLKKRFSDLDILNTFDSNFIAKLLVISNKLETNDGDINLNKFVASLEFSISNLILQKVNSSKDYLKIQDLDKLKNFLKFIGNIKELNKAETFTFLLKTMSDYAYLFEDANSNIKIIPDLINSLREYSIVDLDQNIIEIDVAAVLNHILEKYQKERKWSFYATVGLNQNWIPNGFTNDGKEYTNFNSASEKIGAKYVLWNFDEKYLDQNRLYHKVKKKSLVSNIYTMPYVTGLLYKIANTSGNGFDSAQIGLATGLTFFNSLDFNVSVSVPFESQAFENYILGFSFDIPLSEYLKRL